MRHGEEIPDTHALCVNICEIAAPSADSHDIEHMVAQACEAAHFPQCERLYIGSYFCEKYFLALSDGFLDEVACFSKRFDVNITLVVPIFGQRYVKDGMGRLLVALNRLGSACDEVVANDVACFADLLTLQSTDGGKLPMRRIGLGRLFCKNPRDARYPDVSDAVTHPVLSDEMRACLNLQNHMAPGHAALIEIDPTSDVVDVSSLMSSFDAALMHADMPARPHRPELAIHLPYCYATTGRTCAPASYDKRDSDKFRPDQDCSLSCLHLSEECLTDEGARFIKHGRTFFFENPSCQIAGTGSWRIVYAAPRSTTHEDAYHPAPGGRNASFLASAGGTHEIARPFGVSGFGFPRGDTDATYLGMENSGRWA